MKSSVKVLIVDDDRSSSTLLSEVVNRMGLKSVVVNKPSDALNVAKLQTVHAAIVDVLLPKMSGVDLATEFRKTKFADNPVILVSGVFKDKTFAQEAMQKSGAVNFLFKPYGADELMSALTEALAGLLTSEKWTVQSLLTRELRSARERSKAIERLDKIRGLEFPFVLSILAEARISGHLNIVNENGEIFGVTLANGAVTEVDSTESSSTGVLALISNGYLAQEDWDAYQGGTKRKVTLERLVQEGLVSPHAIAFAKREQIVYDLESICGSETVQVNFVPQDASEETPYASVSMDELLKQLSRAMGDFFEEEYLARFYEPIQNSAIHVSGSPEQLARVWQIEHFARQTALRQIVDRAGTLTEALAAHTGSKFELYSALHYLVLSRLIIFEDAAHKQDMNSTLERYQKLHQQLDGKTPVEIFEYFGAKDRLTSVTIDKIFKEYERANHPNLLPKDAPEELVKLCRDCFAIVSSAHAIMSDDEKRSALFANLKDKEGERVKKANELTTAGLQLLRKGQFEQAIASLTEAERQSPSSLQLFIRTWAEVKGGTLNNKMQLLERMRKIEGLPPDERKSAYYFMALGVVKKAVGDAAWTSCFERVVEMDSSFVEARRELNAEQAAIANTKKNDLLTGDITAIVSQFFRRKAE